MADVTVQDEGSIILLKPSTLEGREWIEENICPATSYQPYWPTVVVGHRYANAIIDAMIADGLDVSDAYGEAW